MARTGSVSGCRATLLAFPPLIQITEREIKKDLKEDNYCIYSHSTEAQSLNTYTHTHTSETAAQGLNKAV